MGMKQQGRVVETEQLSPRLRRLRIGELVGLENWRPGDKVKLGIAGGVKRSYTPSAVDASDGWMDVVVHLHDGDGPFATWASTCEVGDAALVRSSFSSYSALTVISYRLSVI